MDESHQVFGCYSSGNAVGQWGCVQLWLWYLVMLHSGEGGKEVGGRKKTHGERISHKVGSMHYRRREEEGADLELSCWCMKGQKCSSHFYDSSPPLHTHTHPQALCNLVHSAMKSIHTQKYTPHAYTYTPLQLHSHRGSEEADSVVIFLPWSLLLQAEAKYGKEDAFVLSDQPNPFTAFHSLTGRIKALHTHTYMHTHMHMHARTYAGMHTPWQALQSLQKWPPAHSYSHQTYQNSWRTMRSVEVNKCNNTGLIIVITVFGNIQM